MFVFIFWQSLLSLSIACAWLGGLTTNSTLTNITIHRDANERDKSQQIQATAWWGWPPGTLIPRGHQYSYYASFTPLSPNSERNDSSDSKIPWNSENQSHKWRMQEIQGRKGNQRPEQGIFLVRREDWIRTENQAQLSQDLWAMSAIHGSSEIQIQFPMFCKPRLVQWSLRFYKTLVKTATLHFCSPCRHFRTPRTSYLFYILFLFLEFA